MSDIQFLPVTQNPLVIRTDYRDQNVWDAICNLIRAPVREGPDEFYANMHFLEGTEFRDLSEPDLLARVPDNYPHSFLCVVDQVATSHPEFPVLVMDLYHQRGRTFRAVPTQMQAIENNLSIANMDYFEFADNVDEDGIFRDFA